MGLKQEKKVILCKIIHEILKEKEGISLSELISYLRDRGYRIGSKGLKSLLFEDEKIKIKVYMKKSNRHFLEVNRCVVCNNNILKDIYSLDLAGNRKIIARKCIKCGTVYQDRKTGILKYEIFSLR